MSEIPVLQIIIIKKSVNHLGLGLPHVKAGTPLGVTFHRTRDPPGCGVREGGGSGGGGVGGGVVGGGGSAPWYTPMVEPAFEKGGSN